ncbi:hypothetical protein CLOM_g20180 [Closterium sp. NIES-68]|nr:hypothetical protein CLOM_g20180 [Closterium sp. NIES-68]
MTWPSSCIPRSSTTLSDLPADVIYLVLQRLPASSVRHLSACSKGWRAACSRDAVWRALYAARWDGHVADWDGDDAASCLGTAAPEAETGGAFEAASYVKGRIRPQVPSPHLPSSTSTSASSASSSSAGAAGSAAISPADSSLSGSPPSLNSVLPRAAISSFDADSDAMLPLAPSWRKRFRQRAAEVGAVAAVLTSYAASAARQDSLEVADYHRALKLLACSRLVFADVARLLLQPQLSVLLNLLGVHHALMNLRVEPSLLLSAVLASGIGRRVVCVRWWVLGAWGHVGFRMRDEMHTASVRLKDFVVTAATAATAATSAATAATAASATATATAAAAGTATATATPAPPFPPAPTGAAAEPVTSRDMVLTAATPEARKLLGVVCRGAVHEVMRVQIAADFTTSAWVARDMHSQL